MTLRGRTGMRQVAPRRALQLLVAAALLAPIAASAARAQDVTTTTTQPPATLPTTTTPTTVPATTSTLPATSTSLPVSTTATGSSLPTSSTSATTSTTIPGWIPFPELEGDLEFQKADGPALRYGNQPAFDPAANVVLADEVARAKKELVDSQKRGDEAVRRTEKLRLRVEKLEGMVGQLDGREQELLVETEAAYDTYAQRVADAYVRGTDPVLEALISAEDANDYASRTVFVQSVIDADKASADGYVDLRSQLGLDLQGVFDDLIEARRDVKIARLVEKEARVDIAEAAVAVKVWESGSHAVASGFLFPVVGEVSFGDSFGAPRMMGTEYAHWHEGTDIMAASGSPLIACEDGVISRMSSSTLGGISLFLRGSSGLEYYYAHLSSYADGIREGSVVAAGDVIGYVGDTGNARGGSPHLHFEVHLPGGEPVNPFPILRVTYDFQVAVLAVSG